MRWAGSLLNSGGIFYIRFRTAVGEASDVMTCLGYHLQFALAQRKRRTIFTEFARSRACLQDEQCPAFTRTTLNGGPSFWCFVNLGTLQRRPSEWATAQLHITGAERG